MMSHSCSASAARMASAVSTCRCETAYPSLTRTRSRSSVSCSESSTTMTRSALCILPSTSRRRRLVENQPIDSKLTDGFGEFDEVDGLPHVAVRAIGITREAVLVLVGRGEDDDGQKPGPLVAAQLTQDF